MGVRQILADPLFPRGDQFCPENDYSYHRLQINRYNVFRLNFRQGLSPKLQAQALADWPAPTESRAIPKPRRPPFWFRLLNEARQLLDKAGILDFATVSVLRATVGPEPFRSASTT